MANKRNGVIHPTKPFPPLSAQPEKVALGPNTIETFHEGSPGVLRPSPVEVNLDQRFELKALDLHGQRAREMEIIRLLTEIRDLLRNGK